MINPNYKPATITLTRSKISDKAALAGIIDAWDATKPTISTHELADEFAKTLTPEQIKAIQKKHPKGLGDYIDELLS